MPQLIQFSISEFPYKNHYGEPHAKDIIEMQLVKGHPWECVSITQLIIAAAYESVLSHDPSIAPPECIAYERQDFGFINGRPC
jgi:hypothetical protein